MRKGTDVLRTCIVAVTALGAASFAQAQTEYYTFSGTVENSPSTFGAAVDTEGLFGTPGLSLAGDAFTDTVEVNLNNGTPVVTTGINEVYGGSLYGTYSPIVQSTLTINGRSQVVPADYYGEVQVVQSGGSNGLGVVAQTYAFNGNYASSALDVSSSSLPFSLTTPVTNLALTGGASGTFYFSENGNPSDTGAIGEFSATSLTISSTPPVSSVPEPSTYALAVAGMGLLMVLRRRRRMMVPRFRIGLPLFARHVRLGKEHLSLLS